MDFSTLGRSNTFSRVALRTLVFAFSASAAIFCASAGYGLLTMLRPAMSGSVTIGIAEFATHSGLTIVFFALAGVGAYTAKKSCCQ